MKAGTGLLVSLALAARLLKCRHFFLFLCFFFFFFFSCVRANALSQEFLAETVETGHKNRGVTKAMHRIENCERYRAFPERVGPQTLSLESIDYFGISDYLSGRKKEVNWSGVVNFHFRCK